MNDVEISRVMKQLPRASASPRFHSEVLRATRVERRPLPVFRYAAALATTLCLLVAGIHTATVQAEQRRVRALRAEHQRLSSELREVKALASDPQPVVVLENDDTRVIVDVPLHDRTPVTNQPIY